MSARYLFTGQPDKPFLHALHQALASATHIDIAVSFIRHSGLELIFNELSAALHSTERDVQLRLVTSDYMLVTEPRALKRLMLLQERHADIRIYHCQPGESFHLKTYIFVRHQEHGMVQADAFIGSSNLSRAALTHGLEWNYHINFPNPFDPHAGTRIEEIQMQFQQLLQHPQLLPLTHDWITQYEQRHATAAKVIPLFDEPVNTTAHAPRPHQQEALQALMETRAQGNTKGLVVLATGMGKTFLAAFDVAQMQARRVLFVAHREEILLQAEDTFLQVLPHLRVGKYTAEQKALGTDVLFASVQTLSRACHLLRFAEDYFDYIVIDEFHHASANSYRTLLQHFRPRFLLGLTATPERTDGKNILALCADNLVYRCDLFAAIQRDALCPFTYYALFDEDTNYADIPWRSGKFDPKALTHQLATLGRAKHVLKEWRQYKQARTLAFCVSHRHADYMAEYFNRQGHRAVSVHSESPIARHEALARLANGQIDIIFSVDLFNEGVDLPQIDTVLMLRPTESSILFLQQFGRGLRKAEDKSHLVILDVVGNHSSFLNRPLTMFAAQLGDNASPARLLSLMQSNHYELPPGCFVNYPLAFLDFIKQLVDDLSRHYLELKTQLGRRPRLAEFAATGVDTDKLRQKYGSWWEFLDAHNDLTADELATCAAHGDWLVELAKTSCTKAFKLILLQTLLDEDALYTPVEIPTLARWAWQWYCTHPQWLCEVLPAERSTSWVPQKRWPRYWRKNPITFWCKPDAQGVAWFSCQEQHFAFSVSVALEHRAHLSTMTQEILQWRLAKYAQERLPHTDPVRAEIILPVRKVAEPRTSWLPPNATTPDDEP